MEENINSFLYKMRYDLSLKNRKFLIEGNPSLSSKDYLDDQEIINYRFRISDQVHYQSKEEIFFVLDDFISGKIHQNKFHSAFLKLYYKNKKKIDILKNDSSELLSFSIDSKSEGFSDLMDDIWTELEKEQVKIRKYLESQNLDPEELERVLAQDFVDAMKRILLKISTYFKK